MDFLQLVKSRTSCRSYQDKDVPDEVMENCLEAARQAPSACNQQPWRFIVVKDRELRERICGECFLPGLPMPWARQAPVIIVLCSKKSLVTHFLAPLLSGINYHLIDLGIAGEHLVLEAQAQGLGSCWIGWFNPKKVKKLLRLPSDFHPVSLLTMGYPQNVSEPRERLAMNEIARVDRWDSA
jgi:nitroreductase